MRHLLYERAEVGFMSGTSLMCDSDYARLFAVQTQLRSFEHWSAQQAAVCGVTAAQFRLLLAVRGYPGSKPPTIGQLAGCLMIAHNAAVALTDRTEALGLVVRHRDTDDHRIVRLGLTESGMERLAMVSELHMEEVDRIAPLLEALNARAAAGTLHGR